MNRTSLLSAAPRSAALLRSTFVALAIGAPALASAQTPTRDSSRTRADSAQALETVTVSAIRARDEAPISRSRLQREDIEERQHGQDIPLLLQEIGRAHV